MWRDRNLVVPGVPPHAAAVPAAGARQPLRDTDSWALLGVDADGRAWFAADLSAWSPDEVIALCPGAELTELRRVGPLLAGAEAAMLAYARGLLYWHRRQRYCGLCGSGTDSGDGGHLRRCRNPGCGAEHFPRTDPAVIMLITRSTRRGSDAACLLARQARWPEGMMSTLAGFVEPGESLEEAVRREVREEVGIDLDGMRYRGSQPWPFPSSLMLGFRAEAAGGAEIRLGGDELEDARWFTREDIAAFASAGLRLPRRDSIARRLVEEWLTEPPR